VYVILACASSIILQMHNHSSMLHSILLSMRHKRGIVAFNFSPRNLTQVTSAMKPGKEFMVGIASVKRKTLRVGLY